MYSSYREVYDMEKIKILVVDDESRMRKLVKDFLGREGYQVLEAGDGLEAMEAFYAEKDIALIILCRRWTAGRLAVRSVSLLKYRLLC